MTAAKKAKKTTVPLIGCCIEAAGGSAPAGVVLYRIVFWTPGLEYDGKLWIAKSHAELRLETRLTPDQIRDALAKLRSLGLIETSRHHFAGRNVLHIHVTEACEAKLEQVAEADPKQAVCPDSEPDPIGANAPMEPGRMPGSGWGQAPIQTGANAPIIYTGRL